MQLVKVMRICNIQQRKNVKNVFWTLSGWLWLKWFLMSFYNSRFVASCGIHFLLNIWLNCGNPSDIYPSRKWNGWLQSDNFKFRTCFLLDFQFSKCATMEMSVRNVTETGAKHSNKLFCFMWALSASIKIQFTPIF